MLYDFTRYLWSEAVTWLLGVDNPSQARSTQGCSFYEINKNRTVTWYIPDHAWRGARQSRQCTQ